MKNSTIIFFSMFLFLFSCQSEKDKDTCGSRFLNALKKDNDKLLFGSIFSNLEISPLETSTNSLIGSYNTNFSFKNGKCYVLDDRQKALMVFNTGGRFVFKIQQVGKGPGEYQDITDFNVDLTSNKISLLAPQGVIFNYDTLGVFKSKIRLPNGIMAAHYFEYLDSTTVAVYNHFSDMRISICDLRQDSIIRRYLDGRSIRNDKDIPFNHSRSPLVRNGENIYYFDFATGEVFLLDKKGLHAFLDFGVGIKTTNSGIEKHPHLKNTFVMKDINKYAVQYPFLFNFAMSGKKIFGSCTYNKKRRSFLYDIDKKTYQPCTRFKEGVFPIVDLMDGNNGYAIVEPEYIDYYVNHNVLDEKNYEKLKAIKPTSNPILIKYTFK